MLTKNSASQESGFTLIEVLVALTIIAVLGVVLSTGMGQLVQWQQKLLQDMRDGDAQLRVQAILMNDLLQLAPRAVSDGYGGVLPACYSQGDGLECSRFEGVPSTQGVIRFAYQVENNVLWRWRWPVLDRAPTTEPIKQQLMTQIDQLIVRWQDDQGEWLLSWPPAGTIDRQLLPQRVELVLRYQDKERLKMWFPVRAGGVQ